MRRAVIKHFLQDRAWTEIYISVPRSINIFSRHLIMHKKAVTCYVEVNSNLLF